MSGVPIQAAIAAIAREFAATGRKLDVERAAFGLETAYPETSLTAEEIRARIAAAMSVEAERAVFDRLKPPAGRPSTVVG